MASKRLIRRVTLERCARPLLARFMGTHGAAFFEAHGVLLAALATSPARDRALVHRVFELVHDRAAHPALPAALRHQLAMLDALATRNGGEAILRADEAGLLPRATYGDEDLALLVLLDHPGLAVDARREADADLVQSFTEYEVTGPGALRLGDAELAVFERVMGERLEARDRTRFCKTFARREGDVVSLEIVHALRPKTFDKVDAKSLELDQSTDIHTERAFVEVDLAAGIVAVHAARAIKDLVRESLGDAIGASPTYLRPARTYDLSPFATLPAALATTGASPRLLRVELHAIHLQTSGGTIVSFVRSRRHLLLDEEVLEPLAAALRSARPVAVKLHLVIEGRSHGLGVEMSTKGGRNLIDFDRSDPEVVEIVRGYLRARGVLREPLPEEPRVAPSPLPVQTTLAYRASR